MAQTERRLFLSRRWMAGGCSADALATHTQPAAVESETSGFGDPASSDLPSRARAAWTQMSSGGSICWSCLRTSTRRWRRRQTTPQSIGAKRKSGTTSRRPPKAGLLCFLFMTMHGPQARLGNGMAVTSMKLLAPLLAQAASLTAQGAYAGPTDAGGQQHTAPEKNVAQSGQEASSADAEAVNNAVAGRCACGPGMMGHAAAPEEAKNADTEQAGGGVVQTEHPELDPGAAPSSLRQHQLTATVEGYRAAAIAHGHSLQVSKSMCRLAQSLLICLCKRPARTRKLAL